MHRIIATLLMLSTIANAQVENVIQFRGQESEVLTIEKLISVTRKVPVEVPSTCNRQVPYEAYECNDVTRYREECSWIPDQEECRTEYDRQCRDVTRTRQECSAGPSHEVCTERPTRQICTDLPDRQECRSVTRSREECSTGPSRQVCTERPTRQVCTDRPDRQECRSVTRTRQECSAGPSRQVCTARPDRQECRSVTRTRQECSAGSSRQVCTDRPSREVCTDRPSREVCTERNGRRVCSQVGGGRTCQTVGGGQECRTVPGERQCRDVPYQDQECRTVDGGQDCRTVAGERQCRDVPYQDQECRTVDGGQTCSTVGGGQECSTVPGELQCRNIPYQDQECRTVDGGQTCSTVGGGQHCENVPGPQICQDVPYNDQECWNEPRQACETIPGHNDCRQIPYSEQVCGNVTRYNTESYACTRTEQQDQTVTKTLKGQVNVEFKTNGITEEFPLAVILSAVNPENRAFITKSTLKKEPKSLVTVKKNEIKVTEETDTEIIIDGLLKFEVLDPKALNLSFPTFKEQTFNYDTEVLTLTFDGDIPSKGSIKLEMTGVTRFLRRTYVVAELTSDFPSNKVKIDGKKIIINLEGHLEGKAKDGMDLKLTLKTTPGELEGEILNAKKPATEKVYEDLQVFLE